MSALAKHFTVYLPAHPGFALSEGLDQIEDITDLAWHYVDLLDELDLECVPIVGFSIGAWLGAELSILRPDRVERLVMVNAAGLYLSDAPMGEIFIDDLQQLRELVFHDPNSDAVKLALPVSLDDERILNWIRAREATARIGWNPYLHNPRLAQHLHRIAWRNNRGFKANRAGTAIYHRSDLPAETRDYMGRARRAERQKTLSGLLSAGTYPPARPPRCERRYPSIRRPAR